MNDHFHFEFLNMDTVCVFECLNVNNFHNRETKQTKREKQRKEEKANSIGLPCVCVCVCNEKIV